MKGRYIVVGGTVTKMSDDHNTNTNTRKPHNYYDELTPAQREEWDKIEADKAEVKRLGEIGKEDWIFNKAAKAEFTGGNGDAKSESGSGPESKSGSSEDRNEIKIYSVKEGCRLNEGYANIRGVISSLTPLKKMIKETVFTCVSCNTVQRFRYEDSEKDPKPLFAANHKEYGTSRCINCSEKYFRVKDNHINAVALELKDTETYSDVDLLHVILFEEDTKDIQPGEIVVVGGKIHPLTGPGHSKTILPYLYADYMRYESRKEVILTDEDRKAVRRFVDKCGSANIIGELVKMFACGIIGYDHVKRTILLGEVLTNLDRNLKKINNLLLGDTGLSKTEMLLQAKRLNPKSKFVSGENASGKTITAIITNEEGEGRKLHIGAIPSAKGGSCNINELARMYQESQGHILGVMQEQYFGLHKHGIDVEIDSPTAINASANPIRGQFTDSGKIDLNEVNIPIPLVDRFDYVWPYRMDRGETYQREYADQVSEFDNRLPPDYTTYLMKHMMYAKELCPQHHQPKISEKATGLLNEYYTHVVSSTEGGFGSPRVRNTLIKTARAIAMIKLKQIVDEEDARDTMDLYTYYLHQRETKIIDPVTRGAADVIFRDVKYHRRILFHDI